MKTINIEEYKILKPGDHVISFFGNKIAIQHVNGEVSIFVFHKGPHYGQYIREALIGYEDSEQFMEDEKEKELEIIHF